MKDKRFKTFEVSILNDEYKVYVYIGDREKSNKAICKYLNENKEFINEYNRGKCVYRIKFHPCIWIDGTLDYRQSVPTLCHEAIHAVSHIMEYIGMDALDQSGNEFLCHSVGAIIRKCLKIKQYEKENANN